MCNHCFILTRGWRLPQCWGQNNPSIIELHGSGGDRSCERENSFSPWSEEDFRTENVDSKKENTFKRETIKLRNFCVVKNKRQYKQIRGKWQGKGTKDMTSQRAGAPLQTGKETKATR